MEAGNIDLHSRPFFKASDGTITTGQSLVINQDGNILLIPTVSPEGMSISDQKAIELYRRSGKHLGIFDNIDNAVAYARELQEAQTEEYTLKATQYGYVPKIPGLIVEGRTYATGER